MTTSTSALSQSVTSVEAAINAAAKVLQGSATVTLDVTHPDNCGHIVITFAGVPLLRQSHAVDAGMMLLANNKRLSEQVRDTFVGGMERKGENQLRYFIQA